MILTYSNFCATYVKFFEIPLPARRKDDETLDGEEVRACNAWILAACIRGLRQILDERVTEAVLSGSPGYRRYITDLETMHGNRGLFWDRFCGLFRDIKRQLRDHPGACVCITRCNYKRDSQVFYIFWKIGPSVALEE